MNKLIVFVAIVNFGLLASAAPIRPRFEVVSIKQSVFRNDNDFVGRSYAVGCNPAQFTTSGNRITMSRATETRKSNSNQPRGKHHH
jgi:hypothetical protein